MYIIAVVEPNKDAEKGDNLKLQTEIIGALKEEHKQNLNYSIHNNPSAMYQRCSYVSYFFGFDKKLYFSLIPGKMNF